MSNSIAFIADTHDDMEVIKKQLGVIREHHVQEVVHLGDVKRLSTMTHIANAIPELHWITGNGDEEMKGEHSDIVQRNGGHAHGYNEKKVFGNKRFLLRHGIEHELSYLIAGTDSTVDYVMHGHYHHQERTRLAHGEVLNPGDDGLYLYDPDEDSFTHFSFSKTE